jgi:uncharacterized protein (TIGR02413 family)
VKKNLFSVALNDGNRTIEGGDDMTLNLFFLTITVTRRALTAEEMEHEQRLKQIEEEIMDRKYEFYRMF